LADLGAIVKRPQVKILVLERPPGPLNENVILNSAKAIHLMATQWSINTLVKDWLVN